MMNDTIDLRQYIAIALKWWWLLILLPAVAAATGYVVSQRQTPVYQASTTIIVGQSIQAKDLSTSDLYLSERLSRTYAEIAQRQPVLQGVVDTLSLSDSWQGLRSRVTVKPVSDTQLLEITVEASSPEEARVTADEIAHQLILLSPTELQNQEVNENQRLVRQRLEKLQAKIDAGQTRLQTLEDAMSGSISAEQVQELQSEINKLETLIAEWESNHTQLLIFVESKKSPNYLAVIEPAQGSNRPIRPQTTQDTLLAGVVGILLAAGLIFLIEYLDDTIKSTNDFIQIFGLTALGAIARIKGNSYADKLITNKELFSPISEAYRMVRSNIQFVSVDRPARSIMITSATPSEGKSITAANLGIVMAQAGHKTIIVDADLRRPMQHEIFQVPNLAGLTDILCSPEVKPEGHLRKTNIENLHVVTSGAIPPNPSELLGSERMQRVLGSLGELADVVIYDSPPALSVTDAAVLSNRVDGVILVAEAGQTRLGAIRQTILNLQHADANLLGGVLNRAKGKKEGYYYYYHYSRNGRQATPNQSRPTTSQRRWRWLPFFR